MLLLGLFFSQIMYKFFGYVNEIDYHNKSRQSDQALEKYWSTQYGWLRLYTTISIGMNLTNVWKIFGYGVKREHYEKFIRIGELLERFSHDLFKNPFSAYTGTTAKTTSILDRLNREEPTATLCCTDFSTPPPLFHGTQVLPCVK